MTDTQSVVEPQPARIGKDRRQLPSWRWEELRTTFWVVPSILVVVSVLLFIVTFQIDVSAYYGHLTLPVWIRTGSADAERQVLIAIAAAVITVDRRGVLHHDPGADARLPAVRSPNDAQLRARHREPGHARRLRRHVRLLRAVAGDHQQRQR